MNTLSILALGLQALAPLPTSSQDLAPERLIERATPMHVAHGSLRRARVGEPLYLEGLEEYAPQLVVAHTQEQEDGDRFVYARSTAPPFSQASLFVSGDALIGDIELAGQPRLRVRPGAGGQNVLETVNVAEPLPEIWALPPDTQAQLGSSPPVVVDIAVLYTPEAAAGDSAEDMRLEIEYLVAYTNLAYANSGLSDLQLELQYQGPAVDGSEQANCEGTLNVLRDDTDCQFPSAHEIRDALGVDLVCLIVYSCGGNFTGRASNVIDESQGFSVVQRQPFTGRTPITFAHEVGHNFGCCHEQGGTGLVNCTDYGYAYRFGPSGDDFGTLLAYGGSNVPHYSNPDISYVDPLGQLPPYATGVVDEADNVRRIEETMEDVAAYRTRQDCTVVAGVDDCNANGVDDACELAVGDATDLDDNGILDACDIAAGLYADCDGNDVPDIFEVEVTIQESSPVFPMVAGQGVTYTMQTNRKPEEFATITVTPQGALALPGDFVRLEAGSFETELFTQPGFGTCSFTAQVQVDEEYLRGDCPFDVRLTRRGPSTNCGAETVQVDITYDSGPRQDTDGDGLMDACDCHGADLDGDGDVDLQDYLTFSSTPYGPCSGCPADINEDGVVDFTDLQLLLSHWGPCP